MKPKLPRCIYVVVGPRCWLSWNIGDRVVKQCMTCAYVTSTRLISCLCLFDTSSFLLEIGIAIKAQYKKQYGKWPFIHMCILRNEIIFKVTEMRVASCSVQCTIIHSFIFEIYTFPLRWPSEKWNRTRHLLVYWKQRRALLQIYISVTAYY